AIHVEGEVVPELLVLCQKTWNGFRSLYHITRPRSVPFFLIPVDVKSKVRMRRNDWVRRKNQIASSYLEMFKTAQSEIVLLSSYFLPGSLFRNAMRHAVERGVKITVILAGVSDIKMAKLAERYMYEWMLRKDIKIYEYNETILHGKLAICDNEWITLGSFNVNDISTYASVELNLDVGDARFAREVHQYLNDHIITRSVLVTNEYMAGHSSIWHRFLWWSSFSITRVLVFFFTFYFKQVKESESPS
ncbi:MAG TPA: phospholipase D-like domain-containing protein, partial [Cyclobacteriaceae bacterium]